MIKPAAVDDEFDTGPLADKVAGLITVFPPWQKLHRVSFAVLPLAAAPELGPQLGLAPEECYRHDGRPCLLLPTVLAHRYIDTTDGKVLPQGAAEAQPRPLDRDQRGRIEDTKANELTAEHNRQVAGRFKFREVMVPAERCCWPELAKITRAMRDQQVAEQLRQQPVRTVREIVSEVINALPLVGGNGNGHKGGKK